jgi:O-methyltransferase
VNAGLTRVRRRLARARANRSLCLVGHEVRRRRLTYLSPPRLHMIERCAKALRRGGVDGDFVECGIALGGSAVLLASLAPDRAFHGYDVFGMIPPPSENDPPEVHERYATIRSGASEGIGGDVYYGYREDLYEHVRRTFAEFGMPIGERVHLHKGLFQDTLHPGAPIAFAHIDSDWYEPVQTCLARIEPWLAPGGRIVLDDFNDYGGCRRAVEELMEADSRWQIVAAGENVVIGRD